MNVKYVLTKLVLFMQKNHTIERRMQYDISQIKIRNLPSVVGLPKDAELEYYGYIRDENSPATASVVALVDFIIFRPAVDWKYEDFVCVLNGRLCPIKKVVRYRDGGTTEVHTELGTFNFPTPFKPELKPTFNGQEIEEYSKFLSIKAKS